MCFLVKYWACSHSYSVSCVLNLLKFQVFCSLIAFTFFKKTIWWKFWKHVKISFHVSSACFLLTLPNFQWQEWSSNWLLHFWIIMNYQNRKVGELTWLQRFFIYCLWQVTDLSFMDTFTPSGIISMNQVHNILVQFTLQTLVRNISTFLITAAAFGSVLLVASTSLYILLVIHIEEYRGHTEKSSIIVFFEWSSVKSHDPLFFPTFSY